MTDLADLRFLFDQAVSLPPADRAAFFDRVCQDDPAQRKELERLLAAHDRDGSVFDTAHPPDTSAPANVTLADVRSLLASGTRLGPYVIAERLGAGGMGEVYKARDTRLDRSVAIKVLAPGVTSDPAARQRLERERAPPPRWPTRTSACSSTSAVRTTSITWSWSSWTARPSPPASRAGGCHRTKH